MTITSPLRKAVSLHRRRTAVVLLSVCAVLNVAWLIEGVRSRLRAQPPAAEVRAMARYRAAADLLPPDARVRYWPDEPTIDTFGLSVAGRYFAAQYALTPRLVCEEPGGDWVLFDSDDPRAEPERSAPAGWKMAADLGRGLKLYRVMPEVGP